MGFQDGLTRSDVAALNAHANALHQPIKAAHADVEDGIVGIQVDVFEHGGGNAEDEAIGARVLEAEVHVGAEAPAERLDGRQVKAVNELEAFIQVTERFEANRGEDLYFVLEIQVDGGGRVLDPPGDLAHGDAFIALFHKHGCGGSHDLAPQFVLLPGAPFGDAHFASACRILNGVQ